MGDFSVNRQNNVQGDKKLSLNSGGELKASFIKRTLGNSQEISRKQFKQLAESVEGGREALAKFLVSNGILSQSDVNKLNVSFHKGFDSNLKVKFNKSATDIRNILNDNIVNTNTIKTDLSAGKILSALHIKLGKNKSVSISRDQVMALSTRIEGGAPALASFLKENGIITQDQAKTLFGSGKDYTFNRSVTISPDNVKLLAQKLISNHTDTVKQKIMSEYNGFRTVDNVKKYIEDNQRSGSFNFADIAEYVPFRVQRELETDIMVRTLTSAGSDPKKTEMMNKIFYVMQRAGLQLNNSQGRQDFPYQLASALSHGNRVCIALPKGQHQEFSNWLKSGLQNQRGMDVGIGKITASSHAIRRDGTTNELGFREIKLEGLGLVRSLNWGGLASDQNFGINIAVGGQGQLNHNGTQVSDNGNFGHLLMVENTSGDTSVLMIGLENSNYGSDDQWGGTHGVDCHKNPISATGSLKWGDLELEDGEPRPDNMGGMILDLTHIDIQSIIGDFSRDMEQIFSAPETLVGNQLNYEYENEARNLRMMDIS